MAATRAKFSFCTRLRHLVLVVELTATRLSQCHKIYTSIVSDQKKVPKRHKPLIINKLSVIFSKGKLICYPFVTIIYSNRLTFLQVYPIGFNLPTKLIQKCQHPEKFTQKLKKLRQALLVMLMTFRMSDSYMYSYQFFPGF